MFQANPNQCCDRGVQTDCCVNEVPLNLKATIVSAGTSSGCECGVNTEVALTYEEGTFWHGSATLGTCGRTIEPTLECREGEWGLTVIIGTTLGSVEATTAGCQPLNLEFNFEFEQDCFEQPGATTMRIIVTE